MKLKYTYTGEETPEERLRNKLQPLFFIAENIQNMNIVKDFPEVVEAAKNNLSEIRDHLSDIKPFYTIKNPIEFTQNNTNEETEQEWQ